MQDIYHLLRISLGLSAADDFPQLTDEQWEALNAVSLKQTVLGLAWGGIEKLPLEKQPPRRLKLQWLADVNEIKKRNQWMDKACTTVIRKLRKAGMHSVILKGQAVAKLYPTPEYRTPGDIDALVSLCPPAITGKTEFVQSTDIDKNVKEIRQRLLSEGKGTIGKIVYHHIDWRFSDVIIEVHQRPMQLNNPWANKRFQQWAKRFCIDTTNPFPTPDVEFNLVFMLAHLYHHLLFEGVGLRQVCDYVVLLQKAASQWQSEEERKEVSSRVNKMLTELRMTRFAAGFFWIMQTKFALPPNMHIIEPDESVGRFIMKEIEMAGNFGIHDERIDHERLSSVVGKFWERTKHRVRFLHIFPSEILWDIPFRLWHFLWRLRFG